MDDGIMDAISVEIVAATHIRHIKVGQVEFQLFLVKLFPEPLSR